MSTTLANTAERMAQLPPDVPANAVIVTRGLQRDYDMGSSLEVQRRVYRAPKRLQPMLPSGLTRPRSSRPGRRAQRELRGRAAVVTRTVISAARRSVYGPVSVALVILGLLFIGLPSAMAYAFGGVCVWLALAAGLEAFARRQDG